MISRQAEAVRVQMDQTDPRLYRPEIQPMYSEQQLHVFLHWDWQELLSIPAEKEADLSADRTEQL